MEKEKIAVLIPCYNEEKTIVKVIRDFQKYLPDAHIYVYDNNSTDCSYQLAKKEKCTLRKETRQGKGNVVRRMFLDIDAECYLMVDADNTYSAKDAKKMCQLILKKEADMVIGDRLSGDYFKVNTRRFHNFGNKMICFLIQLFFSEKLTDVLSGYRAFSYEFVKSFSGLSKNFEIEVEMTIQAIDKNFKISSIPVLYQEREEGSFSKIHTYSDGFRIVSTIIRLWKEYRPKLFFSGFSILCLLIGSLIGIPIVIEYFSSSVITNLFYLIISCCCFLLSFLLFVTGIILNFLSIKQKRMFELYLKILRRLE